MMEKLYTFQVYSYPHNTAAGLQNGTTDDAHHQQQRSQDNDDASTDIRVFSNMLPGDIGEFRSLKRLSLAVEWSFLVRMRIAEPMVTETTKSLAIHMSHSIQRLPSDIGRLHRLERLELDSLDQLTSLPSELGSLVSLQELHVNHCHSLTYLPESIHKIETLKTIHVEYCTGLTNLSVSFQKMKLHKLHLSGLSRCVIIEFFSHPWNENGAAEQIFIHDCKLRERYPEILLGLPTCSLTSLSLHNNAISTLKGFSGCGLPKGIKSLSLNDNPVLNSEDEKERMFLERLVDIHPRLGQVGWWCFRKQAKLLTPKLQYQLLLNRCGKILLGDAKSIPLSLWSTMLEGVARAVSNQRRRSLEDQIADCRNAMEASVIYSLLHGPALLNRQWGCSNYPGKKRAAQEDTTIYQAPRKRAEH